MQRCIDWYWPKGKVEVVDMGSAAVNGSYRDLMPPDAHYVGVDLEAGPGVDIVLEDPYHLPFADKSVDIFISGQMLEHCGQFWRVFTEMSRVLKDGGLIFMIAPSSGPVHRYPVDCYRFYPDSYAALADWSGLRLVHVWTDIWGPWFDYVGVFQKGGTLEKITQPLPAAPEKKIPRPPHADPLVEKTNGARPYREVLADIHAILKPQNYLEIGVRHGASLALSKAESIAIDPRPDIPVLPSNAALFSCTSDDFFFFNPDLIEPDTIDLAFIDGMHLAEYVYRDFVYVERLMKKDGVIIIDDVLPNHPIQAQRERDSQYWTGDVWRFALLLKNKRPDLKLTWLDTSPTGLLVISSLAPANPIMRNNYNPFILGILANPGVQPPPYIINRRDALNPTPEVLRAAMNR